MRVLEIRLPRERTCAAQARRRVELFFSGLARYSLDDVRLIVSELVESAYFRGRGEIRLKLSQFGEHARVEVSAEGMSLPDRPATGATEEGLRIVDEIATSWGVDHRRSTIWAELLVG